MNEWMNEASLCLAFAVLKEEPSRATALKKKNARAPMIGAI